MGLLIPSYTYCKLAWLLLQMRAVLKWVQKALSELKGRSSEADTLKTSREDEDYALKRLDDALDVRSDRWSRGGNFAA